METQTHTPQTTTTEEVVAAPVVAEPPVAVAAEVAVEGVEEPAPEESGGLALTPATGLVAVLLLSLVAVAVVRLRKK